MVKSIVIDRKSAKQQNADSYRKAENKRLFNASSPINSPKGKAQAAELFSSSDVNTDVSSNNASFLGNILSEFWAQPLGAKMITLFLLNTSLTFFTGTATIPWLTDYDSANGTSNSSNVLSLTIAQVFFEVIASLMLQFASLNFWSGGPTSLLVATVLMLSTFVKHIFVNDIMPPKALMALTGCVTGALVYSRYVGDGSSQVGRKAFVAYHALNAVVFSFNPEAPLMATFPQIEPGSDAERIGLHFLQVFSIMELLIAWMALQR